MSTELHFLYGQAYSIMGAPVSLDIDGRIWVGLRRTLDLQVSDPPKQVLDVVFPDPTMPALSSDEILHLLRNSIQITQDNAADTVSFYGLAPEHVENLSIEDGWIVQPLVHFRYDLSSNSLSPKARRAYRKALSFDLDCVRARSREDFEQIRLTVEWLDFAGERDEQEVKRQTDFFTKAHHLGYGIGLLAKHENCIVAGMYGVLLGDTAYMLLHGYDPSHSYLYPNDFLYVQFLEAARERGAKFVCWGDVAPEDNGLIRMKQKYCTSMSVVYSVHWLGGILSCVDLQV